LLFASTLGGQTDTARERVGKYGYLGRLVIEGSKAFTPDQIRSGLRKNLPFIVASHPSAWLDDYLQVLTESIRDGYLCAGFPDARVEVERDEKAGRARVHVVEGRRFTAGAIQCVGGKKEHTRKIVAMLSTVHVRSREEVVADIKGMLPEDEAAWIPGRPAHFGRMVEEYYTAAVREIYARLGHFQPRLSVRVVPDAKGETATLQIRIDGEGPASRIGDVRVLGVKRDTPEDVRNYLGVRVGDPLDQDLIDRIRLALWRSGRFVSYEIERSPMTERTGLDRLIVTLDESDEAPPLARPLTPNEKVLAHLRQRIASARSENGELEITFSVHGVSGTLVWSPGGGVVVRARTGLLPGRNFHEFDLAITPDRILVGFATDEGARRVFGLERHQQLRLLVHFESHPNHKETGRPFGVRVALDPRKQSDGQEDPFRLDLRFAPVVVFQLSRCPTRIEKGVLSFLAEHATLRISRATGVPLSFAYHDPDSDSVRVHAELRSGLFDERLHALEARLDPAGNPRSVGRFLADVGGVLIEDLLVPALAKECDHSAAVGSIQSAWRKLAIGHIAPELPSGVTADEEPAGEEFVVPSGDFHVRSHPDVMEMVGLAVAQFAASLVTPDSWPWTVFREAAYGRLWRYRYLGHELVKLYHSEEIGPIACLAAAAFLGPVSQGRAHVLARKGLERLTAADFRKDLAPLRPSPGNRLAEFATRVLRGLRGLEDREIDAVALVLGPKDGAYFARSVRALEKAKDDAPPLDVLAPILDDYWNEVLRAQVEAALRRMRP